jgi:NAD(P)H-hydrate epimerase
LRIANQTKLVTVAEMAALEKRADAVGHSYATMMEIAGQAVASFLCKHHRQTLVIVLAGPGNNGGDGLVCARHLHEAGVAVRLYLWKRSTDPEHDYENHYQKLQALGVVTAHADNDPEFATLTRWLDEAPAYTLVDALLGTGNNRPIAGQLAALLDRVTAWRRETMNGHHSTVVAVDCPSGLYADSGEIDPHALPADNTITFAYAKVGHYKFPGAAACGRLQVVDIGIDPALAADVQTFVLDEATMRAWLPVRSNNSHKGSFGKAMLAVGSHNFPGAAFLSCSAAGRVGAGLVTGAVTEAVWSVVAGKLPEPTWVPLPTGAGDERGVIAEAAAPVLLDALAGYDVLAMGCGLNKKPTTVRFVRRLLESAEKLPATLIDADGLNCLAQLENWPDLLPPDTVLTPHAAELGRLCGLSVQEVVARRWELAREKAAAWQAIVLAKGPYTVIAHPDGRLAVLPIATPALATAGTGDVLSGTIAGLLAQGLDPFAAACTGAWLHGQAGLRCAAEIGNAGVVASDLLPHLPHVIRSLTG